MAGDSVLAVFETASAAVYAASQTQAELIEAAKLKPDERRMHFRVGLHLGDVIVKEDNSVYGDDVNIAARLQALAPPGAVMISDSFWAAIDRKSAETFTEAGEHQFKNISRSIRVYSSAVEEGVRAIPIRSNPDPMLPDRPSIAVLAFKNLSGDSEQEYFTDGITEDIITELSRFHELFVIAKDSSFSFKEKDMELRVVAERLGVKYILEGSIRKAGNNIRVNAKLKDAETGRQVWAERYDRALEDIFSVQDELTRKIVMAIAPQVLESESQRISRLHPANLRAYELAVRAFSKVWQAQIRFSSELITSGISEAWEALTLDPRSSQALGAIALGEWQQIYMRFSADPLKSWQAGINAADKLIEIDPMGSQGFVFKALLQINASDVPDLKFDPIDEALVNLRRGYEINPNSIISITGLCYGELISGNSTRAAELAKYALQISPRDPLRANWYHFLALTSFNMNDYESSRAYALAGLVDAPKYALLHVDLAKSCVGLGDFDGAADAFAVFQKLWPERAKFSLLGQATQRDALTLKKQTCFIRVAAGIDPRSSIDNWQKS